MLSLDFLLQLTAATGRHFVFDIPIFILLNLSADGILVFSWLIIAQTFIELAINELIALFPTEYLSVLNGVSCLGVCLSALLLILIGVFADGPVVPQSAHC